MRNEIALPNPLRYLWLTALKPYLSSILPHFDFGAV